MVTFTGTQGEKVDQLITAVVEQRTTLRLVLAAVGMMVLLGFPLLIGLQAFLVSKTFDHAGRLERVEERLGRMDKTLTALEDRMGRIDKTLAAVEDRLGRMEKSLATLESRPAKPEPAKP
jgi:hypothetical protein